MSMSGSTTRAPSSASSFGAAWCVLCFDFHQSTLKPWTQRQGRAS